MFRLSKSERDNGTANCESVSESIDNNMSLDSTASSIESDNSVSSVHSDKQHMRSQRELELEELMDDLKDKFWNLGENDPNRLSILTVHPVTWSIRKIAKEFKCSRRMAKRAKQMRKISGILSNTSIKAGKPLPESTTNKVNEFYNSDANSRLMPRVKDVISVKIDGQRSLVQKRLLLLDLKGLYREYKELHKDFPVSFSKFAQLRPKHCILAGASGTHSVCVCTIHQNCKLMLDAINEN